MKKFLLLCSAVVFALSSAWAQERTVSGKVTSSEDGSALPGVNVVIKGTTSGTVTDAEGNYRLSVPSNGGALIFSFIGLQTAEVVIGDRTVVDVSLSLDVTQLSEVVVTGQGISREKASLGFAATTISSATIANKPETDIGRALQGRTPGLMVAQSSGIAGSGTKINIRGISSFSGNTQPLWVVDGVPINTGSTETNGGDFRDGQIAPTRFIDIDPNNIETINVLRGLNATNSYGSLGRNGVIIVTTKSGSTGKQNRKVQGSFSQQYFVNEAFIPEYQNKWSNGFDGDYGEFFSNWGRLFDYNNAPANPNNGLWWRHPYFEHRGLFPEFPEFASVTGNTAEEGYVPQAVPNNVADFFQKGFSSTSSLNLGISTEIANFNISFSRLEEEGYIKNNNLERNNLTLGANAKLTNKLTARGVFNFVKTNFKSPPSGAGTGSNSTGGPSVFANLFYTPRNMDLMGWPYINPVTGASVYYRNGNDITNPRWLLDNTSQSSNTDRFFGNVALDYKINDWLSATYRVGLDAFTDDQDYWLNKGAVGFPTAAAFLNTGLYRSTTGQTNITDHSLLVNVDKDINEDVNVTGLFGLNSRQDRYRQTGIESTNQLVFGLIEHRNFVNKNDRSFRGNALNRIEDRLLQGAFFNASVGYKKFLFVDVSGRNDWASTHTKANRSLFYPGGSVSFIPTAAFPNIASNVLDFLKVRASYGTSARFADPYVVASNLLVNANFTVDGNGNVAALEIPSLLSNPLLKPETQSELEFGIETKLLSDKITLDLSYYDRTAKNQITLRPLDPSTGYNNTYINAGTISNKGIEATLGLTPIKTSSGLVWSIRANFTRNRSLVEELPDGSDEILVDGFTDLGNFAVEGQPFNVIKGTYVEKDANGNLIVNANGDYKISREIGIIGDPNPDWMANVSTDISFKGFTLSAAIDYVQGGQVFSYTAATMIGRGVAKELESFNPELPLILPGVKEEDGTPNDIPVTTSGYFFGNTIIGGGASDRGIYDATRIRFREISLSYDLPSSIVSKTKFIKNARITVAGNNLWYRAFNTPKYAKADLDRTAFGTSNGAGFDFLGGPSAKRYGATLLLNF